MPALRTRPILAPGIGRESMGSAVGLDFGTTHSAIATAGEGARPRLARFPASGAWTSAFRSLLFFERLHPEDGGGVRALAGPGAIDRYLEAEEPGRLIQSLKSFLPSAHFSETDVLGSTYRLEGLIEIILRHLRDGAERDLGALDGPLVVGRPVRFAGALEEGGEELALRRLRAALRNAGLGEVVFEYEPVAAAHEYRTRLEREELLLIADFGGGTSDFCLLNAGPPGKHAEVLGADGVGVAGDAFDGKIVRHAVAPLLGASSEYRSIFDRVLRLPRWIYAHLERWHHLSFLRSRRTLQLLYDLRRDALEPERLDALIHLVEHDLGFHLYRAVERAKTELSSTSVSTLRFVHPPLRIEIEVRRAEFEGWIAEELGRISACVDGLLSRLSVDPSDVDHVFMTGGSSFVPAVRRIFVDRFGGDRIHAGGEFTSVASGLALRALELRRTSL